VQDRGHGTYTAGTENSVSLLTLGRKMCLFQCTKCTKLHRFAPIFSKILRGRPPASTSVHRPTFSESELHSRWPRPFTVNATRVSASPGVFCQDAQAVFLPHPRNCDVVSHPVSAWKSGTARDLEDPRWVRMSCTGYHGLFCHCLNSPTVCSERPSLGKKWMARKTTPMSTVRSYDNRLAKQHVLSDKRHAVAA